MVPNGIVTYNVSMIHFLANYMTKCRRSYKTQIWGYDDSGAYACPTYKITTRSGALSTTDNLLITFHFGYSIIRLYGVKL